MNARKSATQLLVLWSCVNQLIRIFLGSQKALKWINKACLILVIILGKPGEGATLKRGMTEWRNDGTAERRKITPNPKTRNGGESPQILKRGMAENPKTQNGGKS